MVLKDSDGAMFDSLLCLVLDMESGSNTSRAPIKNRVPPSGRTPQEVPVEDGYAEYEQLSKIPKGQSKVWDEYEKIKGPTPAENKAKCKHCEIVLNVT